MAAVNQAELLAMINGLQKAATVADLNSKLAEFDGNNEEADSWRRAKTNARTKLTKLRLLLALSIQNGQSGLEWPSDESQHKIMAKSQELAKLTQDQLVGEAGVSAATVFFGLLKGLPLA